MSFFISFKNQNSKKIFWSGIIANVIDHYDSSLYVFLAPIIAHLFFPSEDVVVQLIMAYGLLSTSFITRPLGSVYFGNLARKYGPKQALSLSLTGMALFTAMMSVIPTYQIAGWVAPACLVVIRMGQGFFAAGENTISGLYIIENQDEKYSARTSSIYQSSIIAGNCIASFAATLVGYSSNPDLMFRLPFVIGSLICLFGFYLRICIADNYIPDNEKQFDIMHAFSVIKKNKFLVFNISCVSGFSFICYSLAFIFLNSYIPKINPNINVKQLLAINTALMLLDMILLPISGYLADKFNSTKYMTICAILMIISLFPIFYSIPYLSISQIILIRLWFVILGLMFTTPIYTWINQVAGDKNKYILNGVGYSLGIEVFGRQTTFICLSIWHITNIYYAPVIYIMFINLLAIFSLLWTNKKNHISYDQK